MNITKNTTASTSENANPGARYMWLGFAMGLACMVTLFTAGLVKGNAGMMVMASTVSAGLGASWAAAVTAAKNKK